MWKLEARQWAALAWMARRIGSWLLLALVWFLIIGVGLEVMASAYLYFKDGRYIPARKRLEAMRNTYIGDVTRAGETCRYTDTLFPHPYLAFVHHANPPCGIPTINNIGLFGRNFPSVKPADQFVVLLTGGSVAAQFAQLNPHAPRYLEQILNTRYISPSGAPFVVLNGGDGAWKQPQQTILFLLYADAVDAVVTLDGFNEHYMLGASFRFEYPANNFMRVNPLVSQSFHQVVERWLLGKVVGVLSVNVVLSRSEAAYMLVAGLEKFIKSDFNAGGDRPTTVKSIFSLPGDWSKAKRVDWALEQYRKYVRAISAVARDRGVLTAFFVQPVPAIGKHLTDKERAVVGDLSYRDLYRRMTDSLIALRSERRIPVFSMLDVFENEKETLYADPIHLRRAPDGESQGYRLMAEYMAKRLAQAWSLRRKP